MNAATIFGVVGIACGLAACEKPSQFAVPEGASEVNQVSFSSGRAYQTDFTLSVAYPDARALEHYMKTIGEPWMRCDWAPNWDSHLDGTMTPVHTVHQQLHMWVNRDAQRALMLSMRYYSASDCAPKPLSDEQRVVVVEYLGVNVDEQIRSLQLKCPASHVRSNSTTHSDAGEAPQSAKSCGSRVGERGR